MRPLRFDGGLDLPGHKAPSTRDGLRDCPAPAQLRLSLAQYAGPPAQACVAAGERVRRGQRIAAAAPGFGADVHAPRSGRIVAIGAASSPVLPGEPAVEILIDVVDDDGSATLPPLDWTVCDPESLRERLRAAGVVGLGGAGFPTAEKLAAGVELLLLNGAECEPWIACDDALLRVHAGEVLQGGRLLARAIGATRVVLAVEDDMPEALAACAAALPEHGDGIELAAVPTRYPQGGERQLIQALTGREVPQGGLPRDVGVLVQNVATARAAWRAVNLGEALTERIVTVAGAGVRRPGNYVVPLGTTVAHLVEQAGGYTDDAARLLLGGPMMGLALPHDEVPIGKTHNCVLVQTAAEVAAEAREPELPCIRCGDCATACPARLLPQQLLWQVRADRLDRALEHGLFDCIECGCCDLACPSHIPLTAHFRHGKSEQRARDADAQRAAAARDRHESRQQRLERESAERARRDAERRSQAAAPDAVAAALERARAKRAGTADPGNKP